MSQPFQLTEKSFRRYEDHINLFVNNHPKPTSFNPCPLSPNTFAARLRDALRSLSLYNWSTSIDLKKLEKIRKEVSVKINQAGNVVVCDSKERLQNVGEALQPKQYQTMLNICEKELMALVTLLHGRRIEPMKITGQNTATIRLACSGFDVEFIEEKDGIILL